MGRAGLDRTPRFTQRIPAYHLCYGYPWIYMMWKRLSHRQVGESRACLCAPKTGLQNSRSWTTLAYFFHLFILVSRFLNLFTRHCTVTYIEMEAGRGLRERLARKFCKQDTGQSIRTLSPLHIDSCFFTLWRRRSYISRDGPSLSKRP